MAGSVRVVRIDKCTGAVERRFRSITQAAVQEGVTHSAMSHRLERRRLGSGAYTYRYEDGYTGAEEFDSRCDPPVLATDIRSGESEWYPTRAAFADACYYSRPYVYQMVKEGRLVGGRLSVVEQVGFAGGEPVYRRPGEGSIDPL